MKLKKRLSLFLAAVMLFTAAGTFPAEAEGKTYEKGQAADILGLSGQDPAVSGQGPDGGKTEPSPVENPVVSNLSGSYHADRDIVVLNYEMNSSCQYVNIYVNGIEVRAQYTGTAFEYRDIDEGREYRFEVRPYDKEQKAGTGMFVDVSVPFDRAVVEDVDAEYSLDKHVLVLDWEGSAIAYVDIYQDDVLIAQKINGSRIIREVFLEAKSRHTYKVVPYNKNDEEGTAFSYLLEVDDYVARIDLLEADYNEATKQVSMKWVDTYTEYVDISLNGETLVEKYVGDTYTFSCELQPGASYVVCVLPYNFRDEEGEEEEDDVSVGYFDVPEDIQASQVSIPVKDKEGRYTGFSRPSVQLEWEAQRGAVYELYRAEKDKMSAYKWIANIKSDVDGTYTYTDEKAGFGIYYYKIRRKIVLDPYIDQELYTALSEAEEVNALVPRPKFQAELIGASQIRLIMGVRKEFVSGFDIYRKCGKGRYTRIGSTTENVYIDNTVEFGKTYHYRAKAYYYDSVTGKKTTGKPSKSAAVKNTIGSMQADITAVLPDTVKVTWTPAANADGYEIYYKSGVPGDSYVLWKKTSGLSVTRKVKEGSKCYFMIKAFQTAEKGKQYFSSVEVSIRMGFSAPAGLKITKTSYENQKGTDAWVQKDTLSWNRVYGAKGYYIDVYDQKTKKYKRAAKIKGGKKTSYTVSNPVTPEMTERIYRISAYKGGRVKKGDTITITPMLESVRDVKAVNSKGKVKVSWRPVGWADKYYVYRSNGRTMTLIGVTPTSSLKDEGLSLNVLYQYYVQAVNTKQKLIGRMSEQVSYKKNLKKISGLTVSNTDAGTVEINWNVRKDASSYIIYYKDSENGEYRKLAEVSGKKTSYRHKNRKVGTLCYYKVAAVNTNGGGIRIESKAVSENVRIIR